MEGIGPTQEKGSAGSNKRRRMEGIGPTQEKGSAGSNKRRCTKKYLSNAGTSLARVAHAAVPASRSGGLAHPKVRCASTGGSTVPAYGQKPRAQLGHNWDVCVRLQVACGRGWQGVEGTEGCCARGKSLVYKRHLVRAQKQVIKEI